MNSKDKDKETPVREHHFDGIQEFDNPMPTWWIWSFLLAIIFGFIYFIHYTSGAGPDLKTEFQEAMAIHKQKFAGAKTTGKQFTEAEVQEKISKLPSQDLGAQVYVRVCQSCHAEKLQGLVGPNLADEYWIHGQGKLSEIVGVINNGVLDKGMPAWAQQLKEDEVIAVTAFIYSKREAHSGSGKPPQGQAYPEYLKR